MELLLEFGKLPVAKRLNKVTRLYFDKCWQGVLFKGGKMNFKVFNYVSNTIFDNFTEQELYVFYKYLIQLEPVEQSIFDCLRKAKKFIEKEKFEAEQKKLKEMEIAKQCDYGDLLCL